MTIPDISRGTRESIEPASYLPVDHFRVLTPQSGNIDPIDTPRYLVTLDKGIGDALVVGLSVIDQIIANDSTASGKIDVLCNPRQSEIFRYDPRVNRIIETPLTFCPSPQLSSMYKLVAPESKARHLLHFLQQRRYEAVFPSTIAPILYIQLHTHLMLPNVLKLANDIFVAGLREDRPLRQLVRQMVNRYFGRYAPESDFPEVATLYLSNQEMRMAETIKRQAIVTTVRGRVLVVAPDSATLVSRPPTTLLAASLSQALERCPGLLVCILPSYTDTGAAERLSQALHPFEDRVFAIPAQPGMTVLETAALLDYSDICLTGDTAIMHLAASAKKIRPLDQAGVAPANVVSIIALFGGTNPGFYGYRRRSIILGDGRKEQHSFRPGFSKEAYDTKGRDFFDHITPQEVSDAISRCIAGDAKVSA